MPATAIHASQDDPWGGFDAAVLGGGLSPEAQDLIARAGACRQDVVQASALLDEAEALAPDHPAVLIARYRFHFYGHRLQQARAIAAQALKLARRALRREMVGQGRRALDERRRLDPNDRRGGSLLAEMLQRADARGAPDEDEDSDAQPEPGHPHRRGWGAGRTDRRTSAFR